MIKIFKKSIPYTLDIFSLVAIWITLSAFFGYFLVLSQAKFNLTGTGRIFAISFPLYVIFAALCASIEYGALRIFNIKEKRPELRVLNDNIEDRKISDKVSNKDLISIFYSLIERTGDYLHVLKYGFLVIALSLFTEWYFSGMFLNFFVIFLSGSITVSLIASFTTFFTERFIFPTLKQCRELIFKRGLFVEEPKSKFYNLKIKFIFFLLIPILVVLVILIFTIPFDISIIVLSFIGLAMAIMISRTLSSSVYESFDQIKIFAEELPKSEKTFFATGSLESEIIDLSESLNNASHEVYSSREKEKKSRHELKKRIDELEKIMKIIVGRELKMVELKKEIEKLKEKE